MTCSILWSPTLKSCYIGSTAMSVAERLSMHNNAYMEKAALLSKTNDREFVIR